MKKMRFAAVALLLAAIAFSFPREAAAATRPSWLKLTWTWSLENRGAPNAYINVKVTHTNNGDRAVTAIYDKKVTLSGEYSYGMDLGDPFKKTYSYSQRTAVDLWPGESYTLRFNFAVADLKTTAPAKVVRDGFRNMKLNYDCRVRTE
jgi:hypothetical protein